MLILDKARQEVVSIEKEIRVKSTEEQLVFQRQLEDEAREKRQKLNKLENQLLQKDSRLERKAEDLEEKENTLKGKTEELDSKSDELEELQQEYVKKLEEVSSLDQESAKNLLLERVETDFKYDIEQKMKSVVEACKEEAKEKCVNLLSQTVQKVSVDYKSEGLVSVVALSGENEGKNHWSRRT